MVNREVIDILKKYVSLLNAEGIQVQKAYLFGSYSEKAASDESDIDVMIVSETYNEINDEAVGKAWNLTRQVNSKIEPFLIGPKKFDEEVSSPLISMVKEKGILIA